MKKLIASVLFLYSAVFLAKAPSISKVRLLYQKAVTEEKSCKELIDLLQPYNEKNNPLLMGYKAGATMMMARHVFNPFRKLSYFKKGKNMLQKAIEADESNVELRFLRFGVQTSAPSFLGYHDNIATDKAFLLKSVPQLTDISLKKLLVSYLKNSAYLADHEKQQLK